TSSRGSPGKPPHRDYNPLPITFAIPSLPETINVRNEEFSARGRFIAGPIIAPYACLSPEKLRLTTPLTTEPSALKIGPPLILPGTFARKSKHGPGVGTSLR